MMMIMVVTMEIVAVTAVMTIIEKPVRIAMTFNNNHDDN